MQKFDKTKYIERIKGMKETELIVVLLELLDYIEDIESRITNSEVEVASIKSSLLQKVWYNVYIL